MHTCMVKLRRTPSVSGTYSGPGVTGSLQVSRCLTLLSQDEAAATAFYGRLYQHAGVPSAAKVLAMLVRCVVIAARKSGDEGDETTPPQKEAASRKRGKRKGLEAEGGVSGKGDENKKILKASDSKVWLGSCRYWKWEVHGWTDVNRGPT